MKEYREHHIMLHAMRRVVPDVWVQFVPRGTTEWRQTLPYVRSFCLRRAKEQRKLRERMIKMFRFKQPTPEEEASMAAPRPHFEPQTLQEMQRDLFLWRMEHRYKYLLWPKRFRQVIKRTVVTYFGCKRRQWRYAHERGYNVWKPLDDEADAARDRKRMRIRFCNTKSLHEQLVEHGLRDKDWQPPADLSMGVRKHNALVDTELNRHVLSAHKDLDVFVRTGTKPERFIERVTHERVKGAVWVLGLDATRFQNFDKVQEFRDIFIVWEYRIKAIWRRTRDVRAEGVLPEKAVSALCWTAETFLAHMFQRLRAIVRQTLNSELKVVTNLLRVSDAEVRYRVWLPNFPRKNTILLHGWANTSPDRCEHSPSDFEDGMRRCLAHLAVAMQSAIDVAIACKGNVVLNTLAYKTLVHYYREAIVPPNIIHGLLFHCLVSIVHPPQDGQGGRPRKNEVLTREKIKQIAQHYEFEIEVPEPQDEECEFGADDVFIPPTLVPSRQPSKPMEDQEADEHSLALSLSTMQISDDRTHAHALQNMASVALDGSDSD